MQLLNETVKWKKKNREKKWMRTYTDLGNKISII